MNTNGGKSFHFVFIVLFDTNVIYTSIDIIFSYFCTFNIASVTLIAKSANFSH